MSRPLHALLVEDNPHDAELLLLELQGEFDVTYERVETADAMLEALARKRWDIVLSDYSMPRFSAPAALALLKQHDVDIPFIIISGTVGEDVAVEALHAGAHDFLAKRRLARLIPAIGRELRDAAMRAERTKMREQLLISDRMASVGTLAAGVAHEINNPLASLLANLSFVDEDLAALSNEALANAPADDTGARDRIIAKLQAIKEPLQEARDAADRVRKIVRDLKFFSHGDEEGAGPTDIHSVLDSSLRMASNEIRHRARVVKDYGDVSLVKGSEGRLSQVFLNLLVNAAQAIPEGRTDANQIRLVTRHEHGNVVIEVSDTGDGIPELLLPKVFDPFITTKPAGVGTGLGLAICHRIITGLGGQITVDSVVGKGTTFRVVLRASTLTPAFGAVAPLAAAVPTTRGRILIVDDEPAIGVATRRMLVNQHDVTVAANPHDALERIAAGARFDAILCDLMMPDMTGMDLHAELLRVAPDQAARMIFMTGGAFTAWSRTFLDQVENARIEKPFDAGALRTIVNDMVEGAQSR